MTARRASRPEPAAGAKAPAPKLPPYRALPVSELIAFAGNPRVHSPDQVSRIAASITEFGFTNPILIDGRKGIIAGHGRLLAAQKLGLAVVPTIELRGLSDAQKRALVIADNQLSAAAGSWDRDLLAGMLLDLRTDGFDLALTGFDALELDGLLGDGSDPNAEWQGMPEFDQQAKLAFQSIVVHFKDQAAVDAFAATIAQKITPATRFTWFPRIEIERYADKRYTAAHNEPAVSDLHSV